MKLYRHYVPADGSPKLFSFGGMVMLEKEGKGSLFPVWFEFERSPDGKFRNRKQKDGLVLRAEDVSDGKRFVPADTDRTGQTVDAEAAPKPLSRTLFPEVPVGFEAVSEDVSLPHTKLVGTVGKVFSAVIEDAEFRKEYADLLSKHFRRKRDELLSRYR